MADFVPKVEPGGSATDWTTRQALMYALTQCDEYSRVIILFADATDDGVRTRMIQAGTLNQFERAGILASFNKPTD